MDIKITKMRIALAAAFTIATMTALDWNAASMLLASTTAARRVRDHRAKHAVVIGAVDDLIVAVQPDQGGRKLIFLEADGAVVGELGLSAHQPETSSLRGARVDAPARGRGRAGTMLAFWLRLCCVGAVTPTTSRINKPLLALALTRAGFLPVADDDVCVCDVASGSDSSVSVNIVEGAYSFSETELKSQRLVVTAAPLVDGRRVTLHANYAPPPDFGGAAPLLESRGDGAEYRRWLTGKLSSVSDV